MPTKKVRAASTKRNTSDKSKNRSHWNSTGREVTGSKIAAVVYYRMSDDSQDMSIESQRESIEPWAEKNNYVIICEYIDEGISGDDTKRRQAFQRMVLDAETGEFSAILCWDQDRFGRFDSIEAGRWIHPLREENIVLHTMGQGLIDWKDFAGRMIYSIQQEGKYQYLLDLGRNVTRGKISKAQRGEWTGGTPPLGFLKNSETDKLILGETSNVSLVQEMFDLYDRGFGLRAICHKLNTEERLNPKTGNHWYASTVRGILTTPQFTGDHVYPLTVRGKYYHFKNGEVTKRVGDIASQKVDGTQIIIPDNHPAIIERELYERVNEKLAVRKKMTTPHANGGGFYFTGMIYCKSCGSRMHARTNVRNGKGYVYYFCSGYLEHGPSFCNTNQVKQEEIMDEVLMMLENWVNDPVTLQVLEQQIKEILGNVNVPDNVATLKTQLSEVEARLVTASKRILVVDDSLVEIINDQVNELTAEKKRLLAKLESVNVSPIDLVNERQSRIQMAMDRIRTLRQLIMTSEPCEVRSVLQELIERIDITVSKEPQGSRFRYKLVSGEVKLNQTQLKLVHPFWEDCTSLGSVFSLFFEV